MKMFYSIKFRICVYNIYVGQKGDWDFWNSDLVKNPDGTDI